MNRRGEHSTIPVDRQFKRPHTKVTLSPIVVSRSPFAVRDKTPANRGIGIVYRPRAVPILINKLYQCVLLFSTPQHDNCFAGQIVDSDDFVDRSDAVVVDVTAALIDGAAGVAFAFG